MIWLETPSTDYVWAQLALGTADAYILRFGDGAAGGLNLNLLPTTAGSDEWFHVILFRLTATPATNARLCGVSGWDGAAASNSLVEVRLNLSGTNIIRAIFRNSAGATVNLTLTNTDLASGLPLDEWIALGFGVEDSGVSTLPTAYVVSETTYPTVISKATTTLGSVLDPRTAGMTQYWWVGKQPAGSVDTIAGYVHAPFFINTVPTTAAFQAWFDDASVTGFRDHFSANLCNVFLHGATDLMSPGGHLQTLATPLTVTGCGYTDASKRITKVGGFAGSGLGSGDGVYVRAGTGVTLGYYTIGGASPVTDDYIQLTADINGAGGDIADASVEVVCNTTGKSLPVYRDDGGTGAQDYGDMPFPDIIVGGTPKLVDPFTVGSYFERKSLATGIGMSFAASANTLGKWARAKSGGYSQTYGVILDDRSRINRNALGYNSASSSRQFHDDYQEGTIAYDLANTIGSSDEPTTGTGRNTRFGLPRGISTGNVDGWTLTLSNVSRWATLSGNATSVGGGAPVRIRDNAASTWLQQWDFDEGASSAADPGVVKVLMLRYPGMASTTYQGFAHTSAGSEGSSVGSAGTLSPTATDFQPGNGSVVTASTATSMTLDTLAMTSPTDANGITVGMVCVNLASATAPDFNVVSEVGRSGSDITITFEREWISTPAAGATTVRFGRWEFENVAVVFPAGSSRYRGIKFSVGNTSQGPAFALLCGWMSLARTGQVVHHFGTGGKTTKNIRGFDPTVGIVATGEGFFQYHADSGTQTDQCFRRYMAWFDSFTPGNTCRQICWNGEGNNAGVVDNVRPWAELGQEILGEGRTAFTYTRKFGALPDGSDEDDVQTSIYNTAVALDIPMVNYYDHGGDTLQIMAALESFDTEHDTAQGAYRHAEFWRSGGADDADSLSGLDEVALVSGGMFRNRPRGSNRAMVR